MTNSAKIWFLFVRSNLLDVTLKTSEKINKMRGRKNKEILTGVQSCTHKQFHWDECDQWMKLIK